MIRVAANSIQITSPIFLRDFSHHPSHWSLWLMDWKFLKECLDHFFEPSFEWNMWTNALTSFVPLCRRWAKKGKALSKEAHVGSVVNTTQPSRQWTLTKEGVIGMKMKATMKSLSWWKLIKNLTSLGWGSSSWQVLTRGEGGGKNSEKCADIIREQSLI